LSRQREVERRNTVNIMGIQCDLDALVADEEVGMVVHLVGKVTDRNGKDETGLVTIKRVGFGYLSVHQIPAIQGGELGRYLGVGQLSSFHRLDTTRFYALLANEGPRSKL
jgi:hypothetical protein